ncbi:MAG: insulinase family protein [Gemmatimonadota bacterium]
MKRRRADFSSLAMVLPLTGVLAAVFALPPRASAQDAGPPIADTLAAATAAPSAPLPTDPEVLHGTLSNGLTWFVRANDRPEARAVLRLVVNAGSVLEDEDQLGLAHFLEHMAFNGTESFAKQELVDYLERIGMRFGADINAYTSFDETVYMLEVPTDSASMLETGLQILEEWAHAITLDSLEIEKERGVVMEEWRLGRGAASRVRDAQFPVLFRGSRYARRLPIGDPDVIRSFDHAALRRFYRDWYRPDLMAVIAVGDFDAAEVASHIESRFSKIRRSPDAPERPEYDVPRHAETLVSSVTDPELQVSRVEVLWKLPPEPDGTHADYRRGMVERSWNSMMNFRFFEITQESEPPPFLFAGSGKGTLVRGSEAFQLQAAVADGHSVEGLQRLLLEAERVERFGFTQAELDRQKADMLRGYQRAWEERENSESSGFAAEYGRAFLQGESFPGIEYEYALARRYIPGIELSEVNRLGRQWISDSSRVLLASTPEKEGIEAPTEEALRTVFDAARVAAVDLEPWDEAGSDRPLLDDLPQGGSVVAETRHEAVDVTEWRLSNGVRVLAKPTDFKSDQVLFSARSPGGTSLAGDDEYLSATWASSIVSASGAGDFSAVDLQKMLAGKAVSVSPFIGETEEGFSGAASPRDLETLFQLISLYATRPRRDETAFRSLMSRVQTAIANRGTSPEAVWADTLSVVLAQGHPRRRPPTVERLALVDLDQALSFYRERFADFGDFTFTFVGSFELDELRSLAELYLGSLPVTGRSETWRDIGVRPPGGVERRTVYMGSEPKARTAIVFTGPFQYDRENRLLLGAATDVLDIMLREVLREEMGGTYGASVDASSSRIPIGRYGVRIGYGVEPERLDELSAATFGVIDSLANHGASRDNLEKVREARRRMRETDLEENGFWLAAISEYDRDGEPLAEILELEPLLEALTPGGIGEAVGRWLDPERFVQVSLMPAEP